MHTITMSATELEEMAKDTWTVLVSAINTKGYKRLRVNGAGTYRVEKIIPGGPTPEDQIVYEGGLPAIAITVYNDIDI